MIGLDTNVLVRAITGDDAAQSKVAIHLLEGLTQAAPGVINCVVLAELDWTLSRGYGFRRDKILGMIDGMLQSGAYFSRTEMRSMRRFPDVWRKNCILSTR